MPQSPSNQRNPERTRRRILQAAVKLFAKHGYHAVSVDQIVSSVDVNKRMVYHYFGSKEKLFEAVLSCVYQRLEAVELKALESGTTSKEKLSSLIESYFEFLGKEPEFTRLLLWENLEKGRFLKKENHQLAKNPFLEKFSSIVRQGVEAGEFRPDLDIPHLLIHFIGLCFIYHSNRYSLSQCFGMNLGKAEVKQAGVAQVLTLVFEGIAQQPTPTQGGKRRKQSVGELANA